CGLRRSVRRVPSRVEPGGELEVGEAKGAGAGFSSPVVPSAGGEDTAGTKSPIDPSLGPAVIARAPPRVARVPARHSPPPSPRAAASRIIVERPAPQPIVTSSPWNSMRPRQPSSLMTMPRTPLSFTTTLLPPPRTTTGSFSLSAYMRALRTSSTSWGKTKMSAGPPQRREVWKASGSLNRTSPRISPSMALSFCAPIVLGSGGVGGGGQPGTELVGHPPDVPGSQRDDQVAGPHDAEEELDELPPVADVPDLPGGSGGDALGQGLGVDPGDGRLAGRVDIGEHQHVRVAEGGHEVRVQVKCPRVAVGLEGHDDPAVESPARRGQGCPDLGGMVTVVVHHQHPAPLPPHP